MHTIELTPEELRLVHQALKSYLDDFGHEEAELLREIKAADRQAASRGLDPCRSPARSASSATGSSYASRSRGRSAGTPSTPS